MVCDQPEFCIPKGVLLPAEACAQYSLWLVPLLVASNHMCAPEVVSDLTIASIVKGSVAGFLPLSNPVFNISSVPSKVGCPVESNDILDTFISVGFFMWALPQVTYGNNVVPPIQPGSTRLSTQSLIDIKKTTDINVSNISFDSTGQPTFDGTDDILNTGLLSGRNPATDPFTIEAIVKSDTTSGARMWLDATSNGTNQRLYCAHAATGTGNPMGIYNTAWNSNGVSDTDFHHYVIVMDGSTATLYNNGVSHSTRSYSSYGIQALNVGGRNTYRWNGPIPVFKIHNEVLTADQVKQNYNAYKNRFDI